MNYFEAFLHTLIATTMFSAQFSISINMNSELKSKRLLSEIRKIEKNNKKVSLIGSIISPCDINYSHIYVCYNGKLIKIKNSNYSLFTIKDFDSKDRALLFVSPENITFNSEENTISFLKLLSNKKYKFFRLSKTVSFNDNINRDEGLDHHLTWDIQESKLKIAKNEMEIPLNTLIILFDPNCVEFCLENVKWKDDNNIIELPRIIIKKIKDTINFEKSCLSFMNIKCLHCEQDKKEIIKDNVKLSMIL